jgi:hypothetical protein
MSDRGSGGAGATKQCTDLRHIRERRIADEPERCHRPLAGLGVARSACVANDDGNESEVGSVPNCRLNPDFSRHAGNRKNAVTPQPRSAMFSGVPSKADIVILSTIASLDSGAISGTS